MGLSIRLSRAGGRGRRGGYAREEAVAVAGRRVDFLRDEDGDDEAVDGDDTRHDDRDEGLELGWSAGVSGRAMTGTEGQVG